MEAISGGRRRGFAWIAGALLAVFFAQMFTASAIESVTSDEPPHIAGGLSYLGMGRVELNPERPPLLKELSAVFLNLAGGRWPSELSRLARVRENEWAIGDAVIIRNTPDHVMFRARLPMTDPRFAFWLRKGPVAVVGRAYYVYDVN